jgi:hypothetical protein
VAKKPKSADLRINRDPKTRTPFDVPPKGATDARLRPERKPKSRPTHAAKPKSKSPAKALAAITSEAKGIARDTADINTRAAFDAQNSGRSGVKAVGKKAMSKTTTILNTYAAAVEKNDWNSKELRGMLKSAKKGDLVTAYHRLTPGSNLNRISKRTASELRGQLALALSDEATAITYTQGMGSTTGNHSMPSPAELKQQRADRANTVRTLAREGSGNTKIGFQNESTQAAAQKGRGGLSVAKDAAKAAASKNAAAKNNLAAVKKQAEYGVIPKEHRARAVDDAANKAMNARIEKNSAKAKLNKAAAPDRSPKTVKELRAAAKQAGLKGYSKLNKAGLLKALGKGAKLLVPAIAVGAGVMALTRGASVAEAATVTAKTGADMMTGGALSNREAAKARGVSETASTIGGIMKGIGSLATFGLSDLAAWGVSSRKTMKAPNVRAASAKQQKIYAAKAKREQKMSVRQPIAAGKATMPDGMVSAHARRQNGRTVKIAARRMTSKEIAARQR